MYRSVLYGAGALVALLLISGSLYVYQTYRWKQQFALGDVSVVGKRRIELRNAEGKQFFAELSPDTRVFDGIHTIAPSDLPAGVGVVVLGPWRGPERIEAGVVRIVRPPVAIEQE